MKKVSIIILFSMLIGKGVQSQEVPDSTLRLSEKDMQSWHNAKFGLFIHYGLYSNLGQGEWISFYKRMDQVEYAKIKDQFNFEKNTGKHWVEVAKNAGCRYMVVTTRHCDGFCLFDTQFGDFDAVNSLAKRDLIAEYAEAAHEAGMMVGFYYSPTDWRYPGYFFPDMYHSNAEKLKEQTYTQARELLSNYGKVDILWWDGLSDDNLGIGGLMWSDEKGWYTRERGRPYTGKFSWESEKLNTMVRGLQPKVAIRGTDFESQEFSLIRKQYRVPWELCTNLSGIGWGWRPSDKDAMMSLDSCIQLLVTVVCKDGNLLLNVGPKPNGEIEPAQVMRLQGIGDFLSKYGESIYDTRGGFYDENWGGTTVTDKAIYVHVLKIASNRSVYLPPVMKKIISSEYMSDNRKAAFTQTDKRTILTNITNKYNETDVIVKLELASK
ncbi:MAG: alpha-L-fucosidase [Bacteroidales bacterium]